MKYVLFAFHQNVSIYGIIETYWNTTVCRTSVFEIDLSWSIYIWMSKHRDRETLTDPAWRRCARSPVGLGPITERLCWRMQVVEGQICGASVAWDFEGEMIKNHRDLGVLTATDSYWQLLTATELDFWNSFAPIIGLRIGAPSCPQSPLFGIKEILTEFWAFEVAIFSSRGSDSLPDFAESPHHRWQNGRRPPAGPKKWLQQWIIRSPTRNW